MTFTRVNSVEIKSGTYTITTIHYSSQRRAFMVQDGHSHWMRPSMKTAKELVLALAAEG